MVTYMERHTVPSYMFVKCTRRTLRMPSFTRATHAQPSLSNFPWRDSDFGKRTRSRGTTRLEQNFQTSPQNKKTKLTHCSIYVPMRTISTPQINERHAHPSWAPTKEPIVRCWRYTPTSKQDRFQDLLEAICPDFLHANLTK